MVSSKTEMQDTVKLCQMRKMGGEESGSKEAGLKISPWPNQTHGINKGER